MFGLPADDQASADSPMGDVGIGALLIFVSAILNG